MLLKAMDIIGTKVHAIDGEIGIVKDIYFGEIEWDIFYFVIEIGPWMTKKDVLLIPSALTFPDRLSAGISTQLTKQQVRDSPGADSSMPISRQYEKLLHSYYGWTPYWSLVRSSRLGLYSRIYPMSTAQREMLDVRKQIDDKQLEDADPHLHSVKEVKGYTIKATDGELGNVEDLLFDRTTFHITHFVVDTIAWWPSKSVLVDVGIANNISWHDRNVEVATDRETVKSAPAYKKSETVDEELQQRISAYFQPSS